MLMPTYQKTEPRRVQTVTPRKPARAARSHPRRSGGGGSAREGFSISLVFGFMRDYARLLLVAGAVVALVIGYHLFTGSEVFALKSIAVVEASPAVRAEVEQIVRRAVGQTRLMDVDLDGLRQKVEALTPVREASVARILPDKLFVAVSERQPAVLVRRSNGALVWLDEEAIEVGEFALHAGNAQKVPPPPATGFAEGALGAGAMNENRERLALYKQIEQELTGGESLWSKVDEIDLSSTKYVNVRLANSTINVALGSENFRQRFETAINVLKAVEAADVEQLSRYQVRDIEQVIANAERISFIYPAKNNSIVFNFSTPNSEKRASAGAPPPDAARRSPVASAATPKPATRPASKKDDKAKTAKKTATSAAAGKSATAKKQPPKRSESKRR